VLLYNPDSFIFPFQEFDLIEKKELAPLQELIDRLTSIGGMGGGGGHSHSANTTMEDHHH
jgi:hypothetical protein